MSFFIAVLAIVSIIAVYFIIIYNRFVSLNVSIDSSWSDIDVQLKRRHNLIPSLVKVAKGYSNYEQETLNQVIEARNNGVNAKSIKDSSLAENILTQSIGKLFALAEAYPDLKANTTFLELQSELSTIEDDIQNARRYYNAVVRDYNAKVDSFPDLFIARKFNFTPRDYFELDDIQQREVPEIDL